MRIEIEKIKVTERIRKNVGGIEELAANIREHGLISPIAVMTLEGGEFKLLAGLRRLRAMELNGETEIDAKVFPASDAEEALKIEYAENEQREPFTFSEIMDYSALIEEIVAAKARERMLAGVKTPDDDPVAHGRQGRKPKTNEIVGAKVDMSGTQFRRAKYISKHASPEIIEQLDRGERTISGTYNELKAKDKPVAPTKANVPLKDKPEAPKIEAFTVKTPAETEAETEAGTDVNLNANSDGDAAETDSVTVDLAPDSSADITEADTQADIPESTEGADEADAGESKANEPQQSKPRKSKKLSDKEFDEIAMARLSPKEREAVLRNRAFNAMPPEEKVVELQAQLKAERSRATAAETETSNLKVELHNAILHRNDIINSLKRQLKAAYERIMELEARYGEAPTVSGLDYEAEYGEVEYETD